MDLRRRVPTLLTSIIADCAHPESLDAAVARHWELLRNRYSRLFSVSS